MIRSTDQLRRQIDADTNAFREYRAMPQTQILAGLLEALIENAMHNLTTVPAEKLGYQQGAYAQLVALRGALCTDDIHKSAIA